MCARAGYAHSRAIGNFDSTSPPAKRYHDMTEFAFEMEAGPSRVPTAIRRPRALCERAPLQSGRGVAALLVLALLFRC